MADGGWRMADGAALLVDEVLPREPLRQWVLSVPFTLRYLFATDPAVRAPPQLALPGLKEPG